MKRTPSPATAPRQLLAVGTETHHTLNLAESLPSDLTAALDPTKLTPLAEDAMRELISEGESENTVRAYRGALRYWEGWFALRYRQQIALPVPQAVVLQFVLDHAVRTTSDGLRTELPLDVDSELVTRGFKKRPGPLSLSTLLLRMSVLSKLHSLKEAQNPCLDVKVREALSRTRKAYAKRHVKPKKKDALTLDPLQAMLATCDESLVGVRDRSLLMLAWSSGGRRRSEVTQATIENVCKVAERQYVFLLDHSKTDQDGSKTADQAKPIVDEAADALEAWLAVSKIKEGAIFRRVRRWCVIGEPLAPSAVRDIVIGRAKLAGLEGDFSAHSLRSGFVTEAARNNIPMAETMAMTGHTSVATVVGYFRTEAKLGSRAARLFTATKHKPTDGDKT